MPNQQPTGYRSCFMCVCVCTIYIHTYVIEVDYRSYLQKESFPLFYGKFLCTETLLLKKHTHKYCAYTKSFLSFLLEEVHMSSEIGDMEDNAKMG